MSTTTTNLGLTIPADTDTLATAAAAMRALGNGVDALLGGAWTTSALTVTAETGTITTAAGTFYRKKVGRIVIWAADITITTAGTGAGELRFVLPVAAARSSLLGTGREVSSTGSLCQVAGSGTVAGLTRYDNATMIASGRTFRCSGSYESLT